MVRVYLNNQIIYHIWDFVLTSESFDVEANNEEKMWSGREEFSKNEVNQSLNLKIEVLFNKSCAIYKTLITFISLNQNWGSFL